MALILRFTRSSVMGSPSLSGLFIPVKQDDFIEEISDQMMQGLIIVL
jgi:hypothetical protein